MANERRRRARHAVRGWTGRYRLEHASGWRDCTLVDVSGSGAGFEAFLLATDAVPRSIVELELIDGSGGDAIRLRGRLAHLARSPEGHVRIGLEFVDLSELEARLIDLLFSRDATGRVRAGSGAVP